MTKSLQLTIAQLKILTRNARKTGPGDVNELAASIASIGLIHPLKVLALAKPEGKVTHEIIAGSRRYAAVRSLIKAKKLPKTFALPCEEVSEEQADEISLAENVVRTQMHPADQFESFKTLHERGDSLATIAAKFGISEQLVAKRLRLGALAPDLMTAYRQGELDLDQITAFAVTEDHVRQREVFSLLSGAAPAWRIKEALTEAHVASSDRRARFVGIEAYRAAGGICYADLFNREDGQCYLTDSALLDRLALAKLDEITGDLRKEGWAWVLPSLDPFDYGAYPERVYPVPVVQSAEDQAAYDNLSQRHDELLDTLEAEPENDVANAEYEKICATIEEIEARRTAFAKDDKTRSGALVLISANGDVRIERGLVRAEDVRKPASSPSAARDPLSLSEAVRGDLAILRTSMIAACLKDNAETALATVVHALALDLLYPASSYTSGSALSLTAKHAHIASRKPEGVVSRASTALTESEEQWRSLLPVAPAELWSWCLTASHEDLLALLALCAALMVDATFTKGAPPACMRAADDVAATLAVKPEDWHRLSDLDLLPRVSKAYTVEIIRQHINPSRADSYAKLKKAEVVERATAALDGKWLPPELGRSAPPPAVLEPAEEEAELPPDHAEAA